MTTERLTDEARQTGWLIHKEGRGWYRPSAQGYTSRTEEAGRYSHKDALSYSHPNGWSGPRDGITIRHESDIGRRAVPADDLRKAAQRAYDHVVADAANWFQDGSFEQKAMLVEREALRAALLQSAPAPQPVDDLRAAYVEGMRAAASVSRKDGFSDDWLGMTCAILAEADAQEALAKIAQETTHD